MRTKTLILTAAVVAAGAATSMAQVFSVNAVGYVSKDLPAGKFVMISNPLNAADNTISKIFAGLPDGSQIFKFDATKSTFSTATADSLDPSGFSGPGAALKLNPGEGVFVKAQAAFKVTFVGEVPQGTLSTPLVKGLQIVSSQVPQKGSPKDLNLVGSPGDQFFQWQATTQTYQTISFDDLASPPDWAPATTIDVGEAVFLSKAAAGKWDRTFNVNQ